MPDRATQTVPKGYKQTEVGVIPSDWNVKELGKIAHFENGKAHEGYISDDGDYIVINSKFISSEGGVLKYSNKNISPINTGHIALVMSDIPNGKALAKCYLVKQDNKFALNQRICSLKATEVDNTFLFFALNRNNYFLQFDNGVSQTNLRKDDILECPLPIPPTEVEQFAIVSALSDVDGLTKLLEKLIAKKRAIKLGAMQELLTGKRRLPGFSGKWEVTDLGKVAEFDHGRGLPKSDLNEEGPYKCIHYGQLFTAYKELIREVKSRTNINDGCFYSEKNDVLMPTSDVTPRGLATASCVKENGIILGGGILVIRLRPGYDGLYFSYFITQNKTSVLKLVKGSTVFHLYANDLATLEVHFPNLQEQTAIATVFADMEAEIEKLESQLAKYQNLKQGMMQVLLTGKIRLN